MNALNQISNSQGLSTRTADTDYLGFDGVFKTDARIREYETGRNTVANFYVEDGSQVSDHIIVDARMLTVAGEVSDVFYQKSLLTDSYAPSTDGLGNIDIYPKLRTLSQFAVIGKYVNKFEDTKRKINTYNRTINKYGNDAKNILGNSSLKNVIVKQEKSTKSVQAEFIAFIRTYSQLKRLMRVETLRYGVFENMAITSYSFSKDENDFTSYAIDFQEIRKAQTIVTPVKAIAKNPTGKQAKNQTSSKQDKGVVQGTDKGKITDAKNSSLLKKVFG